MPVTTATWPLFACLALVLTHAADSSEAAETDSASNVSSPTDSLDRTHTNRLAGEKSPYLLQHQHNPVDWYPWGEEAFQKARLENKPIFLSIGYSTCHWCHVMERESFENEEVARYLNEHFVSIKVDREERPDVDKIYMTFVQALSGSGGWPLNVFLTPDRKPFYGGTYWPPESKYGRPGFLQVLRQLHEAWATRHDEILSDATNIHLKLEEMVAHAGGPAVSLGTGDVHRAALQLKSGYDEAHGGFGNAPKFPSPSGPTFLLAFGVKYQDEEAVKMVLHTLDKMAAGGIYDQIGGGFSRYSVDAQWLVPHFEKMLYDNAQLLNLYLDAYLVSGEARHADVARDILRYVLRDMTHPEGGFYSAEDADSEGHEGKFYTWTKNDLEQLLTKEEARVAVRYFGVTEKGNFEDHSHPRPLKNQNVLSIADPELSKEEQKLVVSAKEKIFAAREKRVRPHLDDKILASWNGLMLGALARASVILDDDDYRRAARDNVNFLRAKLWDADSKTLYHRWRDGARDSAQLQETYAFLLGGVIDLYETTLNPDDLQFAVDLAETMLKEFYDEKNGGFWQSAAGAEDLILRVKEAYDGAEPSGNSVAVMSLLQLAALTDRMEFREAAEKTLALFSERLQRMPQAVPYMVFGLDYSLEEPRRLVVAGDVASEQARALLRSAHAAFQPYKVVLGTEGPVESFAKTLPVKDGRPTAYLCTGNTCLPPTHEPDKVKELMAFKR